MNAIAYPNKTYVANFTYDHQFGTTTRFVIVVASDAETACKYLKDTIGYKGVPNELIWLMDTNHKTIYDQRGDKPLEVQAKIVYNTSVNYDSY